MKQATYYILHYTELNLYVGLAHNYDEAVLISTRAHATYVAAKKELQVTADELGVRLAWFDGTRELGGQEDQKIPVR